WQRQRTGVHLLLVVEHRPAHPLGPGHRRLEADRDVEAFEDDLGHRVDQVLLVPHVTVEGHGSDPEFRRQTAKANGVDAFHASQLERAGHDRLTCEPAAPRRFRSIHHLTSIRCIPTLLSMSTPYADGDNMTSRTAADSAVETTRSPMFAILRSRPYVLLWTAQFASLLAGFFNYVAIAWLVLQLTGSTLAVGGVLAAASIPMAVLMVFGGAASDRFSPRTTMLVAGLVRGVVWAVLYVWRDVPLRATLIVIAVLNFAALGAIEVGLPALAYQRLGEGAAALGSAFAAWGIGSTIGSILAGTRPVPARFGWFMLATVVLIGVGLAAAGLAPSLPILIVVMGANGLVEGVATTYLISWMQQRTDPAMQGRVMSLAMLSSVGLEPIALAVAGALAAQNLGLLFWASAVAIEATAVAASLSRSVRRL